MTRTERKLGSELQEGDVVVGADKTYAVERHGIIGLLFLCAPGCQVGVLPDISYDVQAKPRSQRERICEGLQKAQLHHPGQDMTAAIDFIEAELDADV